MILEKLDLDKHDLKMVSEFIYETDQNLFNTFLDKKKDNAIKKLRKLIVAGKNSYSYENIYIAQDDDDRMMGILVAFRGDEVTFLEEVKIFFETMNFFDFIKLTLIKPFYDKITASSIHGNDFYIGNLVVNPEYRGQGIGTEILKRSLLIAGEKKCKRVLLDVIFENMNAKKFYEKIGFNVCGEKKLRWSNKSEGTYGMEFLLDR
jgi:ribosomal protein S18 acetylase RimI-like enzyme